MLGDILETIGSLGVLASAMVHYSIAVSGRGQAPAEDPGGYLDRRQGACIDDSGAAHDRASDH
ncbi:MULTISPECIES: hypothetical protein [unclassified Caballeronia]|uniref:hypothetical protein n=1 Tax=unclassified Caballeronia TaxID=2646786 RepID=UPI002864E7F1|nr:MULTISPECIES: hypothetical protein [unclassified Caballeronia]MDR5818733.1 hypothetical protein [Caballeronia sp. LZ033]MDR5825766.1 hypothetical protein [Caballeronia sp. LZ043]MDR5884162.1 hypothetical protein [Caballeronia sp. LZ032]